MGCTSAKAKPKPKPTTAAPTGQAKAKAAAAQSKREKLNPKDYIISKQTGATIIKEDGTIKGEQFNVEECEDCDIFLFDHINSTFVDECKNCRIFVGPVESSIFVRNCQSCDLVIACQQFRSRDCSDCRIALFCTTEPVVETSHNMHFACFDFFYFSLQDQLTRAGLKVWNNKWWQVHDFNKNEEKPNWDLLPQSEVPGLLRTTDCTSITAEELEMDRVIPVSLGGRPWPSQESCFIVFLPPIEEVEGTIYAFLSQASATEGWHLCRSRSVILAEDRIKTLLGWTKENLAPRCKGKEIAGVELCGEGIHAEVQKALASSAYSGAAKSIRVLPPAETKALAKAFFEVWKDEV